MKMQQIQYADSHSKAPKILVESLPVKEGERLYPEIVSKQNTSAMDVMGLSWIFMEDDLF